MNKGRVWPQARARWVCPDYQFGYSGQPCWMYAELSYLFFDDPTNPTHFIPISPPPALAQWEYRLVEAGISYRWPWDLGDYYGEFRASYWPDAGEIGGIRTTIYHNFFGPDYHLEWFDTINNAGSNPVRPAVVLNGGMPNPGFQLERVFAWEFFHLDVANYSLIRGFGQDAENTAPVSWFT